MAYIEDSLSTEEKIKEIFKLHWITKVPIVIGLLLAPLSFGITLLLAIYEYFRLKCIEQGVTNKRVILKTGIISRKTYEIKISSIETVVIDQGILGRMLGYGSVGVTGRGTSDLVYSKVDNPMSVKVAIESIGAT